MCLAALRCEQGRSAESDPRPLDDAKPGSGGGHFLLEVRLVDMEPLGDEKSPRGKDAGNFVAETLDRRRFVEHPEGERNYRSGAPQ
jgi:hypothetical protein